MLSANLSNAARKAIYRRDNFGCALCDSTSGLQIHHVITRAQGGGNSPQNLITLCWRCHAVAHGTRLPETPDYMDAAEMEQLCVESLADLYAGEWFPYEERGR